MSKAQVLVACVVFPEVLDALRAHFEVQAIGEGEVWHQQDFVQRLAGKQGAFITGAHRIDAQALAAASELKIVANMSAGYNNLDVAAMTAAGVVGTNTPDVLTETTADFGFALLMAAARRMLEAEKFLRAGRWQRWRYDMFAGRDVHGSTLGILGMGRIGQAIAQRGAWGFGMEVLYHNRHRLDARTEELCKARYVGMQELLAESDHLMLVLPYTAQAHHIIGAPELARMKPTATLVNIGRGGLVDEDALARALADGRLAAAGLDVFEGEPRVNPALLKLPNVVLTPHIASATVPTRRAMAQLAADNLISFFAGSGPLTPVN
ncbi:D-glycerate dehydrogenase [Comamonas sp. NLF-1-9]|uniref:2-hydroxyacid dehydrogenase n=1 Tax=Comamonas sp. NLF-1-9 TaxID=2853163 RepID=UPI001C473C7B|nr:D-glycerate dehydrogenase [Comamonas sp. NLF-1-9]QXL84599.1 D-glycerate dehydrogenase [Comamonas sp. NLF-1-9]